MNQNEQNNQNLQNQNIPNQSVPTQSIPNQPIPTQTVSVQNTQVQNTTQVVPPNVVPMQEVKVTEEVLDVPVQNTTLANNNVTNPTPVAPPPKNNKASTFLLVLLFLFFFVLVMGMPYIQDFVKNLKEDTGLSEIEKKAKEEEQKQQEQQNTNRPTSTPETEMNKQMTCTSPSNTVGNYSIVRIEKFSYNNQNQILNSSSISQYTFSTPDDDYQTLKKQCDENSLKYVEHPGYTMECSYNDVNVEISHTFDLELFTPIIDGTTNIQANANYKQDITMIKNNLIAQGYTCE